LRRPALPAALLPSFARLPTVSLISRLLFKQGVLASPWWQRVLVVLPVVVLLWLGVHWALGEG